MLKKYPNQQSKSSSPPIFVGVLINLLRLLYIIEVFLLLRILYEHQVPYML